VLQNSVVRATNSVSYRLTDGSHHVASVEVAWAIGELATQLARRGFDLVNAVEEKDCAESVAVLNLSVSGGCRSSESAPDLILVQPSTPDAFAIYAIGPAEDGVLDVCGADARGLVYALTELADRVRYASDVEGVFSFAEPLVEVPTAKVRSVSRCFQSVAEDLTWFHDRDGWDQYLDHLITHRFNRISLTFGMQYNYPYGNEFISDVYFYLVYPFLVSVPGYDVNVSNLSNQERERNLETLKYIAGQARRRGLEFQLAIWTQRYDFADCRNASHRISGIDDANASTYCRDALRQILIEVPEISGLTLRVHVECGIPEGDYGFWETYFEAVKDCGRPIGLDLHAKGIDERLIDTALATGMPVCISPKYTSEHMGLPYHQASIRALELATDETSLGEHAVGRRGDTLYSGPDLEKYVTKWKFSEGSRKFMRYSYGDLLKEDRPYDILFRIWPGTLRVLLWGDAALAGGYGRNSTFCGSLGVELCEPLSFKGRMGTGIPGNRQGYQALELVDDHDWQKFEYTYRIWGRSLYNPEADPAAWRRYLDAEFGLASTNCERALASASRILPLITLAHTPTSSNNSYWPEMYENMSIVREAEHLPYGYEILKPARFGTVGSCDPQLFMSPRDFAVALHSGLKVRKLSPLTWANWLEEMASSAVLEVARARSLAEQPGAAFCRLTVDVSIQAAIGQFFAEKIRSAVLWELYLESGEISAAQQAVNRYRLAREAWTVAAIECRGVYVPDITYGPHSWLRGRWDDRLPAIDRDIADMEELVAQGQSNPASRISFGTELVSRILGWSASQQFSCRHSPPAAFGHGADIELSCFPFGASRRVLHLHYRHVNQSEKWLCREMTWDRDSYVGVIPGGYTATPYPIQYYFEMDDGEKSSLFPGLSSDPSSVPYITLMGRNPEE
jgi:hypothetical protein